MKTTILAECSRFYFFFLPIGASWGLQGFIKKVLLLFLMFYIYLIKMQTKVLINNETLIFFLLLYLINDVPFQLQICVILPKFAYQLVFMATLWKGLY